MTQRKTSALSLRSLRLRGEKDFPKALLLMLIQLTAFWPVWQWFASRITDKSDDSWGWVALITALIFMTSGKVRRRTAQPPLLLPALLTLVYTLSYHFISPLPRAVIAMTAVAATLSICFFKKSLHLGVYGLLLLSLPLIASLQFYLGFPLRALIAAMAAPMLQLGGLPVIPEGACLNWGGRLILIDAPCSGIRMLWTALYLTFTLSCYYRLSARQTSLATIMTLPAVIVGNLFRSTALFYVESGILSLPGWTHEAIGAAIFLLTAALITWLMRRMNERG